uniref:Uncharacterized protein n=1 Tax=Oryza punctata TaxID=4537 RepID=A0A0E0JSV8_ORYPU
MMWTTGHQIGLTTIGTPWTPHGSPPRLQGMVPEYKLEGMKVPANLMPVKCGVKMNVKGTRASHFACNGEAVVEQVASSYSETELLCARMIERRSCKSFRLI